MECKSVLQIILVRIKINVKMYLKPNQRRGWNKRSLHWNELVVVHLMKGRLQHPAFGQIIEMNHWDYSFMVYLAVIFLVKIQRSNVRHRKSVIFNMLTLSIHINISCIQYSIASVTRKRNTPIEGYSVNRIFPLMALDPTDTTDVFGCYAGSCCPSTRQEVLLWCPYKDIQWIENVSIECRLRRECVLTNSSRFRWICSSRIPPNPRESVHCVAQ